MRAYNFTVGIPLASTTETSGNVDSLAVDLHISYGASTGGFKPNLVSFPTDAEFRLQTSQAS